MATVDEREADYHKLAFSVAESLFSETTLYPFHRESYVHFLATLLPNIIAEYSPITEVHTRTGVAHLVHLDNLRYARPVSEESPGVMKAQIGKELHATKMTLLADVIVDLRHERFAANPANPSEMVLQETKVFENVSFFQIPVMSGTELTHDFDDMDPIAFDRCQGTLVTNGYPKGIFLQVKRRSNYPYVTEMRKTSCYRLCCEVRSSHRDKLRSSSATRIYMTREKEGTVARIVVLIPYLSKRIPITMMFRLLGVETLREMLVTIVGEGSRSNFGTMMRARAMLLACDGITDPECDSLRASREDLLVYMADTLGAAALTGSSATLGSRTRESHIKSMIKMLSTEVLPHIGASDDPEVLSRKATFLGSAVAKILAVAAGELPTDVIDDCQHKRYCTAGQTLALKLRQLVRMYVKVIHAKIARACDNEKQPNLQDYLTQTTVTRPLRSALARGNFSLDLSEESTMSGVSQVVKAMSRMSWLSHLTTVNIPLSRDGSQSKARQLRSSKWGIECAAHTPDGRNIGLVTHTAALAQFRPGHNRRELTAMVQALEGVAPLGQRRLPCVVMVNDDAVGRCADGRELRERLRVLREHLRLPRNVSLSFDAALNQVVVHGDEGDGIRPIVRADRLDRLARVVAKYSKHFSWLVFSELQNEGVIEYVNKAEEAHYRVAHDVRQLLTQGGPAVFSHVEIDPTLAMYGVIIGLIAFSQCNQGPRNLYWGAMGPPSIGAMHPMFERYLLDVQTHTLNYPQKRLCTTLTGRLLMDTQENATQMYSVAFLPADGANQEDAIVLNRGSVQRGIGASTKYTVVRDVEAQHGKDREHFCLPGPDSEPIMNRKLADTHAIDPSTGLPLEGVLVEPGDMLISKILKCTMHRTNPITGHTEKERRLIDDSTVWRGNGPAYVHSVRRIRHGDFSSVIVRMRESQTPQVGDKFSSGHSQKGVCSALWAPEDMPFTATGEQMDILFLSHGISSRMTIGQLREMVANDLAVMEGREFDATAFRIHGIRETDAHAKLGACMHTFYCGKTGRMIGQGFMGLCTYTLQRHKVAGKVHARATGPRNAITGQAVEGRANQGGLKISPMEVHELASYGAAASIQETMTSHDGRDVCVCACGKVVDPPSRIGLTTRGCNDCNEIRRVFIPRITLVLHWELAAAGVDMRFHTDPKTGALQHVPC